jgi:hypothetical protein
MECESRVDEEEMERRAAAVPERRDDDLGNGLRADEARNGFVLEEGLAVDVRREAGEEERRRPGDSGQAQPAGASR